MEKQWTTEDLLVLNRWATIARLLSGVAHDVNNALQAIGGAVELLQDLDLPEAAITRLGRIRTQHTRAAVVIQNLLAFTREEPDVIGAIRAAGESETVLLVEDQEAVRELLLLALERAGYQVIEAGNGQEALDATQSHQGAITALVTDVVMPKLNGPDLYERLVKSRPGLKVVFMSRYTEDNLRPWSRDGETAVLEKPFSPTFLTKALRSLIDGQPQTLATS